MLSFFRDFTWEYEAVSLTFTRLTAFLTSIFALWTLWRMVRVRPGVRKVTIIPRPVVAFAAFWAGLLAICTGMLLLSDAGPITSGGFRAVYGTAFTWSIVGMTWILYIGTKTSAAAMNIVEQMEKMKKVNTLTEEVVERVEEAVGGEA